MTHNGLPPAALTHAGKLAEAPLSIGGMLDESMKAIEAQTHDGDLARLFLEYAVSCAFDPDMSIALDWIDANGIFHEDLYEGRSGLAPSWAEKPLDDIGRKWVSACMFARANAYGKEVPISMRGDTKALETSTQELSAYTLEEGAFWGDIFAPDPYGRACDVPEHIGQASAQSRECASAGAGADGEGCGILVPVGSCEAACDGLVSDLYHPACSDNLPSSQKTKYVITVFLH